MRFKVAAALVAGALSLWLNAAEAQNYICPTPLTGDNSNACADTAFVQNTISGGSGTYSPGQVFGNGTGSTAAPAPTQVSPIIDQSIGSTRGSLLERGASGWQIIPPGTSGLPWVSNGAGADPGYQALTAAGIAAATITSTQIASGTITGTNIANGTIANSNLANMVANTVKGNSTAATASPSDMGMPSCSSTSSALIWTANTGFGCNTISSGGGMIPGGRLSLVASTCIFSTDQVAATVIQYPTNCAPSGGISGIPIYDGTAMAMRTYAASNTDTVGLQLTLGSNWAANTLYDVFATLSGGVPVLCTVAWSSSTAGSSSRGTGANTPQIQYFAGVPTNQNSLNNCRNSNSTVLSVAANQATKLGTFLTSGSAGQVTFKFGTNALGGGASCICLFNDFNQTIGQSSVGDTTASWTYTTATYRQADGSTGNQISVVQGVSGSIAEVSALGLVASSTTGVVQSCGVGIDSTSTNSAQIVSSVVSQVAGSADVNPTQCRLKTNLSPGLHNLTWLEISAATGTSTWYGLPGGGGVTGQLGLSGTFIY